MHEHGLGMDLLGGQGFSLLGPALKPWVKTMRADVGNVLVADQDIQTNGSWAMHAVHANGFVAKKGEALLCDTRLMPIGNADNCYDKVLNVVLELGAQAAQLSPYCHASRHG